MEDKLSAEELRHFFNHLADVANRSEAPIFGRKITSKEVDKLFAEIEGASDLFILLVAGMLDPVMTRALTKTLCLDQLTRKLFK